MIYILNTEISNKKTVSIALQNIFGLGHKRCIRICLKLGISERTPINYLTSEMKNKIIFFVEANLKIGDDLKQKLIQLKEEQIRLRCYKGQRAKLKLPRRGQRTKTNARTVKKLN
jgi:small subunit ribosomal protein S13|mmetsp:Transcript_7488/g.12425  ORF Transcript_7488/g.12425 Transcript_7488/m.12425 type:complete len:115 (-) Transcript_7488:444-788(-)